MVCSYIGSNITSVVSILIPGEEPAHAETGALIQALGNDSRHPAVSIHGEILWQRWPLWGAGA